MKKKYLIILLLTMFMLPFRITASGGFALSNSSITIYLGESKTITISSNDSVGRLDVSSSNSGVSSVSTGSIFIASLGESQTFTITGNNVGRAIVSVVGSDNYASFSDEVSLKGITKTVTVNVIAKPSTPTPEPNTSTTPKPNTSTTQKPNTSTTPKPVTKSSDATLKFLELSDGNFEFSSDILEYSVDVSNDVESISINAEANDSKAKVSIPENLNLNTGINEIEIKVIAEDGTQKIYKLHVNRLDEKLSTKSNSNIIFVVVLILFLSGLISILTVFSVKRNNIE